MKYANMQLYQLLNEIDNKVVNRLTGNINDILVV